MDSHTNILPADVVERVLSFLSVPTICKMRVVCKEWNALTNNTTFHALCDMNGKKEDYLFLWRTDNFLATGRKSISPRLGAVLHFFDNDMERWYATPSIQVQRTWTSNPNEEMAQWFISLDKGLVGEAMSFNSMNRLHLSILDPIAKIGKGLPSPSTYFPPPCFDDTKDPSLVLVVDQDTYNYKVFFFNNKVVYVNMPWAYVFELDIQKWRPVGGIAQPVDDTIAFQNTAFVSLSKGASPLAEPCQLCLFRYQVEGDTFAKVWEMNFTRRVVYSKLLVCHNRLFVLVITRLRTSIGFIYFAEDLSDSELDEACFQTHEDAKGAVFEMYEILLDEGSAKPVVQFTEDALHAIWGDDMCTNSWFAFPCLDSKGGYTSVVLMEHHSGEMRRFHLATGAVDVLPACPLSKTIPDMEDVTSTFDAKTMPLSLRDVLKHAPPTV